MKAQFPTSFSEYELEPFRRSLTWAFTWASEGGLETAFASQSTKQSWSHLGVLSSLAKAGSLISDERAGSYTRQQKGKQGQRQRQREREREKRDRAKRELEEREEGGSGGRERGKRKGKGEAGREKASLDPTNTRNYLTFCLQLWTLQPQKIWTLFQLGFSRWWRVVGRRQNFWRARQNSTWCPMESVKLSVQMDHTFLTRASNFWRARHQRENPYFKDQSLNASSPASNRLPLTHLCHSPSDHKHGETAGRKLEVHTCWGHLPVTPSLHRWNKCKTSSLSNGIKSCANCTCWQIKWHEHSDSHLNVASPNGHGPNQQVKRPVLLIDTRSLNQRAFAGKRRDRNSWGAGSLQHRMPEERTAHDMTLQSDVDSTHVWIPLRCPSGGPSNCNSHWKTIRTIF